MYILDMYFILCVRICRGQSHEIQGQGHISCRKGYKGTESLWHISLHVCWALLSPFHPPRLATLLRQWLVAVVPTSSESGLSRSPIPVPGVGTVSIAGPWAPASQGVRCTVQTWLLDSLSMASKEDTLITACAQELETSPERVWTPHKEGKKWPNMSKYKQSDRNHDEER